MTRRKGSQDYPKWMKREAIKLYLEEGWSARGIMERYSIIDRNRVSAWVRQYCTEGEAMFEDKRHRSALKNTDQQPDKTAFSCLSFLRMQFQNLLNPCMIQLSDRICLLRF